MATLAEHVAENIPPPPTKSLFEWLAASLANSFDPSDPILACGDAVLSALQDWPDHVIRLAHEKLHSFPYQNVPTRWRRLFEEASLHKVLKIIESIVLHDGMLYGQKPAVPHSDWISDVVHVLDKAAIISGLPRRKQIVHETLNALDHVIQNDQDDLEPALKRRKLEGAPNSSNHGLRRFATNLDRHPKLRHAIPEYDNLSFDEFQDHLLTNNDSTSPIIIKNALSHWPALHDESRSWSNPNYLLRKTLGGRRLVPVEFGRSYTDPGWGQRIITFGDFLNGCLVQECDISGSTYTQDPIKPPSSDASCSYVSGYASVEASDHLPERKINVTGYLAQHDLFSQIPSLRSDITVPDYCYCTLPTSSPISECDSSSDEPFMNAWLGPGGTISPLHTDPYHNIFCQVVGFKYIKLYAPDQTPYLYPHGTDEQGVDMSNTSQVDLRLFSPNYEEQNESESRSEPSLHAQYPLFRTAHSLECVLGPGDSLYIPKGWWHYVESLSTSFSVSFWWS
ncbi:MAG: hypothetical protein M1821_002649 [Bathelium mastoideum]|nr:MAG: hypothetical protein M1821_002649 [Bathelium mastoideum]